MRLPEGLRSLNSQKITLFLSKCCEAYESMWKGILLLLCLSDHTSRVGCISVELWKLAISFHYYTNKNTWNYVLVPSLMYIWLSVHFIVPTFLVIRYYDLTVKSLLQKWKEFHADSKYLWGKKCHSCKWLNRHPEYFG